VEFLGEILAPSSPLQSYDFEELPFIPIATHFPQANNPPPSGAYTIGPVAVDLEDLRRVVSIPHPDHGIFVYLPGIPLPSSIPVNFFCSFFPPSSATSSTNYNPLLFSISTSATYTYCYERTCILKKITIGRKLETQEFES